MLIHYLQPMHSNNNLLYGILLKAGKSKVSKTTLIFYSAIQKSRWLTCGITGYFCRIPFVLSGAPVTHTPSQSCAPVPVLPMTHQASGSCASLPLIWFPHIRDPFSPIVIFLAAHSNLNCRPPLFLEGFLQHHP